MVLILVFIDQVLKIFINKLFFHVNIFTKSGFIGFKPFFNKDISSLKGGLINLNIDIIYLTMLNIVILLFIIGLYKYLKVKNFHMKGLYFFLNMLISAAICSIIDKIFWNGSLDFIVINRYIIDFKDIYLFISCVFLFFYAFKIGYKVSDKEALNEIKKFFRFLISYFKGMFRKDTRKGFIIGFITFFVLAFILDLFGVNIVTNLRLFRFN